MNKVYNDHTYNLKLIDFMNYTLITLANTKAEACTQIIYFCFGVYTH